MKGQLAGLMKQAQEMQENLKKAQEQIASMEIEGQAGAGMVKVIMTGRHDIKRVSIDASLMGDDKEMLEDIVTAAANVASSGTTVTGLLPFPLFTVNEPLGLLKLTLSKLGGPLLANSEFPAIAASSPSWI